MITKIREFYYSQIPSYFLRLKSSLFGLVSIVVLSLIFVIPNSFAAQVRIAWDPNTESNLAGYKIYYGLASRNYESCIDIGSPPESSASTLKYVLMDLESGKRYYIAVIAYDKKNNKSIFSNEVSAVAE